MSASKSSQPSQTGSSINILQAQADAVGRLAQDAGAFAAVIAAFQSRDPDALKWVLQRLELLPHCEVICEWVRIKLCVLRCLEICGPPVEATEFPSLRDFAPAVVKLASNEKLLRRAVDAVSNGDADSYRDVLAELKLNRFCHLFCRWICTIVYERVCHVVCFPGPVPVIDPATEIRDAAKAIAPLVANKRALNAVSDAATSLNSDALQSAIAKAVIPQWPEGCYFICRLICSWRCAWVCTELCRLVTPVPTSGIYAIEEARSFALATRQLAGQPRALGDLVNAVQNRNAATYGEIIARFGLGPYCWQVCAWVCSITCHEFCIRVCPPPLVSYFTRIGALEYATQIDSTLPATGLTVGDTRAFFQTLRLNGVLTQTIGGQPLEYTFEYIPVIMASTTLKNSILPGDLSITVASSAGFPTPGAFNAAIGSANGGYEIITVTNISGTTWTVSRGQQGTTAAQAVAGAAIVTGVATSGSWKQVPQAWIRRTVIGYLETFRPFPLPPLFTNIAVIPNTGEIPAPFTADGWIQVPQGASIFLNGDMINLDSTMLPGFSIVDETGVKASYPANPIVQNDLYFGLRMRVRQHGSSTDSDGGTCSVAAIYNNLYKNVNHHSEWDGGIPLNPEYGVCMVDIAELQLAGCADITNSLTVLFTASHPNLGSVSLSMKGDGGTFNFTLPTPLPQTGDWYGTATNGFTLSKLPSCAYVVTLSVDLLLTTGDNSFGGPLTDQIGFCYQ